MGTPLLSFSAGVRPAVADEITDDTNQCRSCGRFRFHGVLNETRLRVAEEERASTVTEIFTDLVYIFVLQAMLQNKIVSGSRLSHFAVTYAAMFNSWIGTTFYNTRFNQNDLLSCTIAMLSMTAVVGMASAIRLEWGGNTMEDGLTRFSCMYISIRVLLLLNYSRTLISQHHSLVGFKRMSVGYILGFSSACACWLCVAFCRSWDVRWLFLGLGFCFDYGTPFVLSCVPELLVPWPTQCTLHPLRFTLAVLSAHCPFSSFLVLSTVRNTLHAHLHNLQHRLSIGFAAGSIRRVLVTGITQMAFAGCLFMFVGNIVSCGASIGEVLRVGILGVTVVYPLQLLHDRDTGPDVNRFEAGLLSKLQTYAWLYLHMPLTMALTARLGRGVGRDGAVVAVVLGDCLSNGIQVVTVEFTAEHVGWYRAQLCLSTASFHVLLGIIHLLSTPHLNVIYRRKQYCTRFVAAALLIGLSFSEWSAVSVLLFASLLGIIEVLIDALQVDGGADEMPKAQPGAKGADGTEMTAAYGSLGVKADANEWMN